MKKLIFLAVAVMIFAGAQSVSAASVSVQSFASDKNWDTYNVHTTFENSSDRLIVVLNNTDILSAGPEWVLMGEVPVLVMNKTFSFDINSSVDPHDVSFYMESNDGTRVRVR